MTENEAIEELKYDCNELGKAIPCDTSWGKSLENAYAMAIKALEEVQRWHTSVINPNIKNEFANTSTQICHNCDHKDEYIEELEAEVEEYRAIGTPEELQEMKKDFAEALSDWRQYRKVGTLEECRAAVEKQTAKRPRIMGNAMICPSCPRCFKSDNSAYCPSCGQKLKWGDEE